MKPRTILIWSCLIAATMTSVAACHAVSKSSSTSTATSPSSQPNAGTFGSVWFVPEKSTTIATGAPSSRSSTTMKTAHGTPSPLTAYDVQRPAPDDLTEEYAKPLDPSLMTVDELLEQRFGAGNGYMRQRVVFRCPDVPLYDKQLTRDPRIENPLCLKYTRGDVVFCGNDLVAGAFFVVRRVGDMTVVPQATACYRIGIGPFIDPPKCYPIKEICNNGKDDDCDGVVDNCPVPPPPPPITTINTWSITVPFVRTTNVDKADTVTIDMRLGDEITGVTTTNVQQFQVAPNTTQVIYARTFTALEMSRGFSFRARGVTSTWTWPNGKWNITALNGRTDFSFITH